MPNFNGAIILHAMELINSPATLREILMIIAQNTELPAEDIKVPVKQTLEMGLRSGFLQKAEGRYYLEPITFSYLMSQMRALDTSDIIENPKPTKSEKSLKSKSKTCIQKIPSREAIKHSKPIPKKSWNDDTHRNRSAKPTSLLNDGTLINPKPKRPLLDGGIFKSSNPLPKLPLLDNISVGLNTKTISNSRKKSVTSLAIKPKRVTNKQ